MMKKTAVMSSEQQVDCWMAKMALSALHKRPWAVSGMKNSEKSWRRVRRRVDILEEACDRFGAEFLELAAHNLLNVELGTMSTRVNGVFTRDEPGDDEHEGKR